MFAKFILKGRTPVLVKDIIVWGRWFAKADKKIIVKQETLSNGLWVSTVFLGIDHNFFGTPPLLFETMVFPSKSNLHELDMERYSTWEEAEAGHKKMVSKYKAKAKEVKKDVQTGRFTFRTS